MRHSSPRRPHKIRNGSTQNEATTYSLRVGLGNQTFHQLSILRQLLDEYSPQQRRDLGFDDSQNVKNLLQMIRAFRSTVKIMLIDVEDLQDQITQEAQDETPIISKFSKLLYVSGALAVIPSCWLMYRRFC